MLGFHYFRSRLPIKIFSLSKSLKILLLRWIFDGCCGNEKSFYPQYFVCGGCITLFRRDSWENLHRMSVCSHGASSIDLVFGNFFCCGCFIEKLWRYKLFISTRVYIYQDWQEKIFDLTFNSRLKLPIS